MKYLFWFIFSLNIQDKECIFALMVKFDKLDVEFKKMYIIGDIHSNFGYISWFIKHHNIRDSIILQVGDFGVGFAEKAENVEIKKLNSWLKEYNCYVVAIRGNHDNPACFKNDRRGRVILLDDYTIISIQVDGKPLNVIGIGGAVSIDRIINIKNGFHFYDEGIIFEKDVNELDKITDIDIVLTHSSPDFAFPFDWTPIFIKYMKSDSSLKFDVAEERKCLRELLNNIILRNPKLKVCYYGHFHTHDQPSTYFKGVEFKLLGAEEFIEYNAETYSYFEDDYQGS